MSRVLAQRRHELILDEVRRHGAVRVRDLTELLGVSDMTIRRDLDVLAAEGLLEKVHGGATAIGAVRPRSTEEPGFEAKLGQQTAEKETIAGFAASMVQPGTAIGITAGTTTWSFAQLLGEVENLVVVTNCIRVAEVLAGNGRRDLSVVVTGGVRTPSDALVGPIARHALGSLHLDQVFMGVHGMAETSGFTTPNLMEAETNRAFVTAARRLVVLADHTKWGTVGLATIADLDEAHVVVTDDRLSPDAEEALRSHVGEVVLTGVSRPQLSSAAGGR